MVSVSKGNTAAKKATELSFSKDSLYISKDRSDEMDRNSAGGTPKMDWTSRDVPTARKAFRQHCEFTIGGSLKRKSEEEKCNYLMIWIGDKGRDIQYVGTHCRRSEERSPLCWPCPK